MGPGTVPFILLIMARLQTGVLTPAIGCLYNRISSGGILPPHILYTVQDQIIYFF